MNRFAVLVLLFACLGLLAPVAALEGETPYRIAGQEVGWFFSGADDPTLILWHQFDQQMGLGIPRGRDSWEILLAEERGDRFLESYNILALSHPWHDAESALGFSEFRLREYVARIHNFLRRQGGRARHFHDGG